MTPTPGILSVNSDTINPLLSKPDFDTWYCNEHIPDVVSKSGISHAYRYRTLPSSPSRKLNFLTIYGMQDIGFMESAEFKSVEGQSPGPSRGRIFEKAEFDTRSYGLVDVNGDGDGDGDGGPRQFLVFMAFEHTSRREFEKWDREEHVERRAKCGG